jgi:hypothetical protein
MTMHRNGKMIALIFGSTVLFGCAASLQSRTLRAGAAVTDRRLATADQMGAAPVAAVAADSSNARPVVVYLRDGVFRVVERMYDLSVAAKTPALSNGDSLFDLAATVAAR